METPASLLERLQHPAEHAAWERFVKLYTPLLLHWARRLGARGEDAADLAQDVLVVLVQKLPAFRYDRDRSFRGWLSTVTLNRWREKQRRRSLPTHQPGADVLAALPAPDGPAGFDEADYRQYVAGRALQLMQADFAPSTWKAFWECAVSDRPAADVAAEFGLTVDGVYAAKSRVLRRLRQELKGLVD